MRRISTGVLFYLLVILWSLPLIAQETVESKIADTSSPRATLRSFIDAVNELSDEIKQVKYFDRRRSSQMAAVSRALDCLNVSGLPEFVQEEAAAEATICLKEILDRSKLPDWADIPDIEEVTTAGDKLKRWHIPGTRISIAQVEEGPRKYEYLFTPGTIERVFSYYQEIKDVPYRTEGPTTSPGLYEWYYSAAGNPLIATIVDAFPPGFKSNLFGQAIWKWAGLLVAIVIAIGVMMLLYRLQRFLANRWRENALWRYCATILLPVLAMVVPQGFKEIVGYHLTLRGNVLLISSFTADLVTLLAGVVVVFSLCNRVAQIVVKTQFAHQHGLNAQLTIFVAKITSIVLSVILILEGGQYLGIPITTLLASAGVGGLAVALAAQNALKGMIGTMLLMIDKPFRVGDRIVAQNFDGVVERMGLRSTKLRLLTGHIVSIPNDQLADHNIENIGTRRHIRRKTNILIPLDTSPVKLEKAVAIVRGLLNESGHMDPEKPPRVNFNEFNEDSFNIKVYYWFTPPNYWEFLEFSEALNVKICQAFEEHGIQFSLPVRVAHTSREGDEAPVNLQIDGGKVV